MAHFQQQITKKQDGWSVETREGADFIPGDIAPVPEWLARGVAIDPDGDSAVFDLLTACVQDYCASGITSIEAIHNYYFARLSAPGYLDCTDWVAFRTLKAARDYLKDI